MFYAPEQTPDRWRCKLFPKVFGHFAGTLKAFEGWGNVHSIWTVEMDDLVAKQQSALSLLSVWGSNCHGWAFNPHAFGPALLGLSIKLPRLRRGRKSVSAGMVHQSSVC